MQPASYHKHSVLTASDDQRAPAGSQLYKLDFGVIKFSYVNKYWIPVIHEAAQ